jgi:hypothetical protein
MAVRQRVEGLSPQGPEGGPQQPQPPAAPAAGPGQAAPPEMTPGKLDTRYISPTSAFVVVVRPAQILASPIAHVFPVEVVSATALKTLGIDANEIEEIDEFVEISNPTARDYGATFKFKNPIRASSIPAEQRSHTQLAELNGKKYLRSAVPMMPSFYGPNNKTLVVASDAALHKLVENASQPKSGPMIDRLREVPSGSDLFLAVEATTLRPFMPMVPVLLQSMGGVPPEAAKQLAEILNATSGLELTLNVSAPGPTSLVGHFNDDAAAQKAEMMFQEFVQRVRASAQAGQPSGGDPVVAQAMERYIDRLSQLFQPQRSGSNVTFIHVDGQNPAQQQLVAAAIVGAATAAILPTIKARWAAAMQPQAVPGASAGPEGGVPPVAPAAPGAGP